MFLLSGSFVKSSAGCETDTQGSLQHISDPVMGTGGFSLQNARVERRVGALLMLCHFHDSNFWFGSAFQFYKLYSMKNIVLVLILSELFECRVWLSPLEI